MPVTSIQQPQKGSYILVKFSYVGTAGATNHRYTDWSSDVLNDEMLGGSTFTFVRTRNGTVTWSDRR
jgi:hypothetical protein